MKTNKVLDMVNPFFIIGMLIPAGIRYISESIFLNVEFFVAEVSEDSFILITFLILSGVVYFSMIKQFKEEKYVTSIKAGYVISSIIIVIALVFVIMYF